MPQMFPTPILVLAVLAAGFLLLGVTRLFWISSEEVYNSKSFESTSKPANKFYYLIW